MLEGNWEKKGWGTLVQQNLFINTNDWAYSPANVLKILSWKIFVSVWQLDIWSSFWTKKLVITVYAGQSTKHVNLV